MGYTVIKAPFTGRVSRHKVDVGNVISPQTGTLASIVSQDPVYASFTAPADSILPLLNSFDDAKSIPLELAVGDGPYSIKGKLDYISPQVDASSGTLALRGVFPNTDGKLLPGLFVRVQVPTEREDEVMVIPRQAVLENQGKSFVYVIAQDSRARMVPVATGPAVGSDRIAVISGITPESLVIYDGMAHIRQGMAVTNTAQ